MNLEPVNPNRQRITNMISSGLDSGQLAVTTTINNEDRGLAADSVLSGEPYPNVIIYGDPEKLNPLSDSPRHRLRLFNKRSSPSFL